MRPGAVAIAVAAIAVTAVVGVRIVGDDDGSDAAGNERVGEVVAAADDAASVELPPDDREALAEIFDPLLEPLGLRLTRGGLQDSPGAADDPSLRDRHLAVYVEPISPDHTPAQFAETLITSAQVFLPGVFERWPGLASMDVCQEPPPGVDDRHAPPPYTVLELSAADAEQVDWANLDLAALLSARDAGRIQMFVDPVVEQDPAYAEAAGTASPS